MAKKEKPSVDGALNNFKETMLRASLSDYVYVNNILITVSPKGYKVVIVPEQELWLTMIQNDEMKRELSEADLLNPDDAELAGYSIYGEELTSDLWIPLDTDKLYTGKIIKVKVNDTFDYEVPINRELLPLKLKKAEYKDISYRVFTEGGLSLCVKKKFTYPLDNCGFTMIRIFKII